MREEVRGGEPKPVEERVWEGRKKIKVGAVGAWSLSWFLAFEYGEEF